LAYIRRRLQCCRSSTRPKEPSTDRIERVLNPLIEDQKKSDPTTH
jgi:hypothetical protein